MGLQSISPDTSYANCEACEIDPITHTLTTAGNANDGGA
jgi:hypothetical protein